MSTPTRHFAAAGAWAAVGAAAAGCELATSGSDSPLVQALASTLKVYRETAQERLMAHVVAGVGLTVEAAIQVNAPMGPSDLAAFAPWSRIRLEYATPSEHGAILRAKHAARVLASIPDPLRITAATLRARQPREADRAPLPLS